MEVPTFLDHSKLMTEKFDPLKSCEYFSTCFKDPSNFTVVLVGNIDRAIVVQLILHYLVSDVSPRNIFLVTV